MLEFRITGNTMQDVYDQMRGLLSQQTPIVAPCSSPAPPVAETAPSVFPTAADARSATTPVPLSAAPSASSTPAPSASTAYSAHAPNPAGDGIAAYVAQQPAAPVPTAVPTYTFDQLANAGATLVTMGKMDDCAAVMAQFGITNLAQLDPSRYGEMATALRALGAQI